MLSHSHFPHKPLVFHILLEFCLKFEFNYKQLIQYLYVGIYRYIYVYGYRVLWKKKFEDRSINFIVLNASLDSNSRGETHFHANVSADERKVGVIPIGSRSLKGKEKFFKLTIELSLAARMQPSARTGAS